MSTKPERWYEVEGDEVRIYDHPYPDRAASVSIVKRTDLPYYRTNFRLTRCWVR